MYKLKIRYKNDLKPPVQIKRLSPGQSILEICMDHNLGLRHECGGMSICGTCSIRILKGESSVEFQSKREIHTLQKKDKDPLQLRLACQCILLEGRGEIEIEIPVGDAIADL
ncbi:MAG: (2Fe-2S)-binding protein [Chitinophagaceae bacterium]|nr:MAG: (2Fe-2S)-binding protein [Chitinophagaceae bacterium]